MSLLRYARRLRAAYRRDTSELEELWTPGNPSVGHCHVTALLIQETYGGTVLEGIASSGFRHFWNLIDGITIDVTRDQFPPSVHIGGAWEAGPPNSVTRRKAELLRSRM